MKILCFKILLKLKYLLLKVLVPMVKIFSFVGKVLTFNKSNFLENWTKKMTIKCKRFLVGRFKETILAPPTLQESEFQHI